MLIDLKKIERSGKRECEFFFEYSPEHELSTIPNSQITLPIKIEGSVTLTGRHACYIEGEIAYTLKGECTRCLEETSKDFVNSFSVEVDADDEESYPIKNDVVDLTKIVEDEIIMNMPVAFLCREDCKGICLGCGANLNKENCKCEK